MFFVVQEPAAVTFPIPHRISYFLHLILVCFWPLKKPAAKQATTYQFFPVGSDMGLSQLLTVSLVSRMKLNTKLPIYLLV